jgi:hypothetical protein
MIKKGKVNNMFNSFIIKVKKYFCKHDYKRLNDEKCIGETMGWGGYFVPEFESTYECVKCKAKKNRRYIYFGNFVNKDGSYNFKK